MKRRYLAVAAVVATASSFALASPAAATRHPVATHGSFSHFVFPDWRKLLADILAAECSAFPQLPLCHIVVPMAQPTTTTAAPPTTAAPTTTTAAPTTTSVPPSTTTTAAPTTTTAAPTVVTVPLPVTIVVPFTVPPTTGGCHVVVQGNGQAQCFQSITVQN